IMETILLLIGVCCIIMLLLKPQRPKNFPPGPEPLPVFGNVLQLSMKNPVRDLEELSGRYGKVYSLFLGWRPAVVIHGLQAVREALVTRAVDFAGRPQGMMINHVTENKGVLHFPVSVWREHRRFALATMKNFGLGKRSMEERILEETTHICNCLEKSQGRPVDPLSLIHSAASNIICSVLFGQRYDYNDDVLAFIINSFKENAQIANGAWAAIYDTFPLLRRLPLPFQKVFKNYRDLKMHTQAIVEQHKHTRVPGKPRDVVDCYLDEMDKRAPDGGLLDEERLVMLLLDLHFAGTDTSSNSILSAILYLATHSHIQGELCQREIDRVLGESLSVSFEDRHRMPFLMATIHETQRLANIAPLGVFHATTRDTKLMGYDIPEGTLIITNLTSVLFESTSWERPNDFYPGHFLDEDGQFVKPDAFLAFSAGPRVCLGELLARMELFLILVSLLRRFLLVWPEDAARPDLTPVFGGIQSPRPYRVTFRLRAKPC
uniref:Cytochrome P450, family 2, subfamily X, polypeptide 9 n=1 Tax=Myripristis murdjan TaxID=586833 RepID=A0A667YBA6_9TELE